MNLYWRIIVSLLVACLPALFNLYNEQDVKYPICAIVYSICLSLLTYHFEKDIEIEVDKRSIKKDLEFAEYVLKELKSVKPQYKKIRVGKLNKLEDLISGCQCIFNEGTDHYNQYEKQFAAINSWASTFENEEEFETKDYNKSLRDLRTFIQKEKNKY